MYGIITVPTPTVAWTRAWLIQGGGGVRIGGPTLQVLQRPVNRYMIQGQLRHLQPLGHLRVKEADEARQLKLLELDTRLTSTLPRDVNYFAP